MAAVGLGIGVVLGCLVALTACSGRTGHNPADFVATSGAGGQVSGGGKASAGSAAGMHSGGVSGSAAAGEGAVGDAGEPSIGGTPPSGGQAGADGDGPDLSAILTVKPTPGCGTQPTQPTGELVQHTIQTSGFKEPATAADSKKGEWSYLREYYLWLPPQYDPSHAYPLVIQAPGCGADGTAIYSLSPSNDTTGVGVNGSVIRVGLTPPPDEIGHSTNPNQGCFDDKEGDDSVDFVFYEKVIDRLKTELCYDENRVFASGNSSGAWLANELGCKYAGNTAGYAIRGVAINGGGLPIEPQYRPTCSDAPMAGLWVVEVDDTTAGFSGWKPPINRALEVNGCQQTTYETVLYTDFPIGGGNPAATCGKVDGCPDLFPLVVCALPGSGHGPHAEVANPAFATFIQALHAP